MRSVVVVEEQKEPAAPDERFLSREEAAAPSSAALLPINEQRNVEADVAAALLHLLSRRSPPGVLPPSPLARVSSRGENNSLQNPEASGYSSSL